jgi:hypothetical protein
MVLAALEADVLSRRVRGMRIRRRSIAVEHQRTPDASGAGVRREGPGIDVQKCESVAEVVGGNLERHISRNVDVLPIREQDD